jgi:hypothetical protein
MSRTMFWALALPALAATALAAPAQEEKLAKGKSVPPGVAVEARLVANKATYPLDLGGLSAEEFQKKLQDTPPAAPQVDLTLELVNTSDKDVQIRVGGTMNIITLDLKGPGAQTIAKKGLQPRFIIASKTVTLAPGKSAQVPITSLAYGLRGLTHAAYWTAPGEYALAASYQTALKPAPEGARDAGDGFGAVTLTSTPVKIMVKGK